MAIPNQSEPVSRTIIFNPSRSILTGIYTLTTSEGEDVPLFYIGGSPNAPQFFRGAIDCGCQIFSSPSLESCLAACGSLL